jgi:3-hexulose-6-phosphate synthase/6-phospho-3-hexuloisomerase
MELKDLKLKPPVVQIALDFATIEEALAVAKIGVEAGVDWLEIGTPLIVSQGLRPISEMVKAFPNYPVLADYKTMDSGGKNVHRTKAHGGHIMTVCANSPDETVQAAVAAGKETGIWVIADTIGVKNQAARARQCEEWGVDMVYLHYGTDERVANPTKDSTQFIDEVFDAVSLPVGVGCFDVEDAIRAAAKGADNITIGHPVVSGPNALEQLTAFVKGVHANYKPRKK